MIRHGRHVPNQCLKQKYSPVLVAIFNIFGGDFLCLGHWLGTWRPWRILHARSPPEILKIASNTGHNLN